MSDARVGLRGGPEPEPPGPLHKSMRTLIETSQRVPRERLAEVVSAAGYGTVLVLAALGVVGVSEVALGHGSELVAGVGVATWLAHIFAELLGGHVRHPEPLHRSEVVRSLMDGSPILVASVLPAIALGFGRLDLVSDTAARIAAIVVAVLQLLAIGAFVARVAPARPAARWTFAAATAGIGLAVVVLTVLLGH
jgi:hypothetical protein